MIWKRTIASSFADPADLASFKRCKAKGRTDSQCFLVGDNGIGLWGESTVSGSGPACALPPREWQPFYHHAKNKKVLVRKGDKTITVLLKDTLPHSSKRIDLNADACALLGLKLPALTSVEWKWA